MRERIRDKGRLEHILESIDYIFDFSKGIEFEVFKSDMKLRFAIIKNLEIIGEASNMLTNEFREQNPEMPWRELINLRHVLAFRGGTAIHKLYLAPQPRYSEDIYLTYLPNSKLITKNI